MKKLSFALLCAVTGALFAGPAVAFDFGLVDAAKIFNRYSETQRTKRILEGEKAKLQTQLDTKKKAVADLDAKYVDIAKNMQALRDDKKEAEARDLEGRLRAQRDALAAANADLQKFFAESQQRLYAMEERKMGDLSKTLDDRVDAVIKQIAQRRQLKAVFEKRFCYYGGIDITNEVLEALNKGTPIATGTPRTPQTPASPTGRAPRRPAPTRQ